jgi:hypothetical protein
MLLVARHELGAILSSVTSKPAKAPRRGRNRLQFAMADRGRDENTETGTLSFTSASAVEDYFSPLRSGSWRK